MCKPAFEQIKGQAERIGEQGVFLDEIGFSYLLDRKNFLLRIGITCGMALLAFFSYVHDGNDVRNGYSLEYGAKWEKKNINKKMGSGDWDNLFVPKDSFYGM